MDIEHGLQVLELGRTATLDEVRQAYKDMVNVWHPDRFSHSPRLKAKAESKLKEINAAYEVVESHLASKPLPAQDEPVAQATARPRPTAGRGPQSSAERTQVVTVDRTEAIVEAGTRLFLTACSYLYKKLSDFAVNQGAQNNSGMRSRVQPSSPSAGGCRVEGGKQPGGMRRRERHCRCGNGPRQR